MSGNSELNALLITSFLLQYPDEKWQESLIGVAEAAEKIKNELYSDSIFRFLEYAKKTKELDLAELYSSTFDFAKSSNLYLTYYLFKEQQERGLALLKLKRKYAEAGFAMVDSELPDFLPVILEFAAASRSKDILVDYINVLQDIFNNLSKANNPYSDVLKAILMVMEKSDDRAVPFIHTDNRSDYSLAGGGTK